MCLVTSALTLSRFCILSTSKFVCIGVLVSLSHSRHAGDASMNAMAASILAWMAGLSEVAEAEPDDAAPLEEAAAAASLVDDRVRDATLDDAAAAAAGADADADAALDDDAFIPGAA